MRILLSLIVLLIGTSAAFADDSKTLLSAKVLWELERAGAPVVSPNGEMVVVPLTSYDEDNESETRLWLLANDGTGARRPITAQGSAASSPVFSPAGDQLAFISKRDKDEAGQNSSLLDLVVTLPYQTCEYLFELLRSIHQK